MRRFASIDFLRGLAIVLMLFLHMISDSLDIDTLLSDINNIPLINLVMLIVLPYLGGLAGFFLLVSAIGNMVSMQKYLQAGKSVKSLFWKQVIGGFILLFFAFISEGFMSIWGTVGNFFWHLPDPQNTDITLWLYQGYNFETIHTIAWCVIVNGIVQAILSRKEGWKNPKKLIIIYIILIIIVIGSTQFVWWGVSAIIPGYPWAINPVTNQPLFKPMLGKSSFWEIVVGIFVGPLAAHIEPIFPYLAISFVGSIIGIVICQKRELIPHDFPKKLMIIGLIAFIIGTIGVIYTVIYIMNIPELGFDGAVSLYKDLSSHRSWTPDKPEPPFNSLPEFSWIWQFLSLNGFTVMGVMFIIRLVEFRGNGALLAKNSKFVRRFGTIALTMYSTQWISILLLFLISQAFGVEWHLTPDHTRVGWDGTLIIIALDLLIYHGIMLLWERVGYIGSLEWSIATLGAFLIPVKKTEEGKSKRWYQKGMIDVKNTFYDAEWINIIEKSEIPHDQLKESKLAYKVAWIGIISILFIPLTFFSFFIALNSRKTESSNKYNRVALIISLIGMIIFTGFIVMCFAISLSSLGVAL